MAARLFQFRRNAGPSLEGTAEAAPTPAPQCRTHTASLQLAARTSVRLDETNPSESSQARAPEIHQSPSWGTELLSANTNLRTAVVHSTLLLEVQHAPKGSTERQNAGAWPLLHRKEESTAKPTEFLFLAFKKETNPSLFAIDVIPPLNDFRRLFQCIYLIINMTCF